jgi:hypothetical protein
MNTLGQYIFSSVTRSIKFHHYMNSFKIWKQLFLFEKRNTWTDKNTSVGPIAVFVGGRHVPNSLKQIEKQSQDRIESQIIHNLTVWKKIDDSYPKSQEIYKQKYGEEYIPNTTEEKNALRYMNAFDRSKTNMNELWEKIMDEEIKDKLRTNEKLSTLPFDGEAADFLEFVEERENRSKITPKNEEQVIDKQFATRDLNRMRDIEKQRLLHLTQHVKKELGWVPYVNHSSIEKADKGLFIDGYCPRGTVIGLYPGMTYSSSILNKLGLNNNYVQQLEPGKHGVIYIDGQLWHQKFFELMYNQIVPNFDDSKIDGKWLWLNDEESERKYGHIVGNRFIHPFSQLEFTNHPKQGATSNVIAAPFIVKYNFPPSLLPYIPNKHFQPPILLDERGLIRTIVYIAERDISNEEIFIDYRYNPYRLDLPDWYHPLDRESDEIFWKG